MLFALTVRFVRGDNLIRCVSLLFPLRSTGLLGYRMMRRDEMVDKGMFGCMR